MQNFTPGGRLPFRKNKRVRAKLCSWRSLRVRNNFVTRSNVQQEVVKSQGEGVLWRVSRQQKREFEVNYFIHCPS